jgi:hypothetical protein
MTCLKRTPFSLNSALLPRRRPLASMAPPCLVGVLFLRAYSLVCDLCALRIAPALPVSMRCVVYTYDVRCLWHSIRIHTYNFVSMCIN